MKKSLRLLLLIVMISTFAACSSKPSTSEAQATETESFVSEESLSEIPETEAPTVDDSGKEIFFGEWVLDEIVFYTPDEENGIFVLDGSMIIQEGFTYGRDLSLSEDMKMVSSIDLNTFIEEVPELPFVIDDLDLNAYSGWTYSDGVLTPTPDGPVLRATYDEAAEEMRLTRSEEVEIMSTTTDEFETKSGMVLIEMTLVFKCK